MVVRVGIADAEPHRHDVEERRLVAAREVVADREAQLVLAGLELVEQRRAPVRVRDRGADTSSPRRSVIATPAAGRPAAMSSTCVVRPPDTSRIQAPVALARSDPRDLEPREPLPARRRVRPARRGRLRRQARSARGRDRAHRARRAGRAGGRRSRRAPRPDRARRRQLARRPLRAARRPGHPRGLRLAAGDRARRRLPGLPEPAGARAGRGRRDHHARDGPRRARRQGRRHRPRHLPSEVEAAVVPGRSLQPPRRGRARPLRGVRALPAGGGGGHRPGARGQAARRLDRRRGARRPQRRAAGGDDAGAARAARVRDRDAGVRPSRPGRRHAVVEPRAADPGGAALHPHLPRAAGADRPRARRPRGRRSRDPRRHGRPTTSRRSPTSPRRGATRPAPTHAPVVVELIA